MFIASAYEYLIGGARALARALPRPIVSSRSCDRKFNISETINLYYNGLISLLCRAKDTPRQGGSVFCMKLSAAIIISLMPLSAAFAQYDPKSDISDLRSKTPALRQAASHRLARSGGAQDREKLRDALRAESSPAVRAAMTEALAQNQGPEDTAELISVVARDASKAVRMAAVYALGYSRSAAAAEALRTLLAAGKEDRDVRQQAAAALANYPAFPETYPALLAAASDGDEAVRAQALVSLCNAYAFSRRAEVKARLNAALNDASPLVKKAAADRLAFLEAEKK